MTSGIPEFGIKTADMTKLPLEFVRGTIDLLETISLGDTLPSPVQLYLGIFKTRDQPHNYIALPWSPLCIDGKIRFPIHPLNNGTIWEEGYGQVLGIISQSLAFIDSNPPAAWKEETPSKFGDFHDRGIIYFTFLFVF